MKITTTLQSIGTQKCLEKAKQLEGIATPIKTLHFRNLELNAANISAISDSLQELNQLQSISFSYNPIGDLGTIALVKNLPKSLTEMGLVNCGITDIGGIELLNWMKKSPQLRMICVEQNNFSAALQTEFRKFSTNHPQTFVMF